MHRMKQILLAFLASVTLSAQVCADSVNLRSSRKAKADVTEIDGGRGLLVKVSFIAVSTLGNAANERISRLMSRSFAGQAVRVYSKTGKGVDFSKSRMVSCNFDKSNSEEFCTVVYEIPKSALVDAAETPAVPEGSSKSREAFEKACGTDGESAMENFRSTCYRDLRVAEAAFLFEIDAGKLDRDVLRREIESAFSSMCEKSKSEDMLFISEKEELAGKIEAVKSYLLKKLGERDGGSPKKPSPEETAANAKLISKGEFGRNEYKDLIMSDSVLLTTGGCRIFPVGDKAYIVGVGCTEVRNDTSRDRIRRRETAQEKARVQVIKSRSTDVSFFKRSLDKAVVRYKDRAETSEEVLDDVSTTTVKAADYVDSMDIVATWYSADGQLFFLALGCACTGK